MSEQTSADTIQTTVEAQSPKPNKRKKSGSGGALVWFNFLLILMLAGVVAAGGWFGWQHHSLLVAQLDFLKQNAVQHHGHEQQVNQQLAALEHTNNSQNQTIEALKNQTRYTADQLDKLAGADQQDWLVAEAEYLLRLANQRLNLERDWGSALAMLQAADKVLLQTGNPRLEKVRAHIANEILALRKAPSIDRQGAILRIQSLQNELPNLPWLPEKLSETPVTTEKKISAYNTPWYAELWQTVSESLVGLVRIRERNSLNEGPLSPEQQYFLQQNMYLMLEQAQIAMLREEQALYQHSLKRVSDWVSTYLIIEDNSTQALQQSLEELAKWQVAPERPDISESLLSLQKLIEQSRRGQVVGGDA